MQLTRSPALSAIVFRCPQCNGEAKLRLVEPDQHREDCEWHVFECENCGLPRSYSMGGTTH
jgi:hypothetical protein